MLGKRITTKRLVTLALLSALGLITFMLENLFPPLFVPGAKMGLSNVFSLTALVVLGPVEAVIVVLVRILLGSLFTNVSALIYSLTAGLISIAVEILLFYLLFPRASLVAVSIFAAVAHNLAQNAVYVLVTGSPAMFAFAPYLAMIAVGSGAVIGTVVLFLVKKIPTSQFAKILS